MRHENYFVIKYAHSRSCRRCKYLESATAHTLFHKIKFPLHKAFYIAFLVVSGKKGISTYELERKLSLRQKTCWAFKSKVVSAMESSRKYPLDGQVEVDEFYIGGPDEDSTGRKSGNKRQVVLAIQVKGNSIQRSYAKVIPSGHSIEFEAFFDAHIKTNADIITDGWSGYKPLVDLYPNLKQERSEKGKNFPLIHRQIMMIKGWIRGIHHQCKNLQAYLDEFNYRFNRLNHMKTIFHNLIVRMVERQPSYYQKYITI